MALIHVDSPLGWFLLQDVFLGHQNAPIMTGKKLYTTLFATPNIALEDKKKVATTYSSAKGTNAWWHATFITVILNIKNTMPA